MNLPVANSARWQGRSLSDGHTVPRLVRYEKAGHNRGTFRNEPPAGSVSWKCALARISRSRSSKPGARSVCPHLVQWSSYHLRSRNPWVIASCHQKPGDRPPMRHVSSWCPPCLSPFPGDQPLLASAAPSRAEDRPGVLHRQEPHVPVSPAQESVPGGVQSPPAIPSVPDTGINESWLTAGTALY